MASPARGAEVLVSLDYQADPALPECPSAADFGREVTRQLGHDPFRVSAPRRLVVRLYPTGARLGGRVEWRDAADEWEGERTFSSRNESCAQMARAMALATAIQIQLLARVEVDLPAKTAAESKPPAPAVVEPQPPMATPAPAAPVPREPLIAVDVGVGAIGDAGDSPTVVLPRIALYLGRPSAIGARLAIDGFGPGAQVTEAEGAAQIDRFVMTLELVRFFRAGRTVEPLVAVGGGWQDLRARGTSATPTVAAHERDAVSGLITASGGLAFFVASRLALVVELQTLFFRPAVTVQIGSAEAAHLDGASLFAHGGLLARF
ncbi:MAG TPA: hypothetical protein VI456_04710 [Polyangia bacterium]